MTATDIKFPIPPASARALEIARTWPLTTSYDVGYRLSPGGDRRGGWTIHIRCAHPGCQQSVLSTSNDSGSYVWSWRDHLAVGVLGHIMQCHREASGVDAAESLPEPQEMGT